MKFDKALNAVFNNKKAALNYWKDSQYIHILHNVVADSNGSNYRPTVTEMNSGDWRIL